MIVSISGKIIEKTPSEVILDVNGLGYKCFITSNTYSNLTQVGKEVTLLTYFHVTESSQSLFAFDSEVERSLFQMLIGVSGIGPKTAIILLSSVTPEEFKQRLIASDVEMLTELKGIGPKTARRIIVELKDKFVKLTKDDLPFEDDFLGIQSKDAYNALTQLGFNPNDVKKEITAITKEDKNLNTESIIKKVLSILH